MLTDFLTIEPRKEYNHFNREDIYIIPCRLLEFGEEATHNSIWVTIEHLDFKTGDPVVKKAKCYKRSLRFFKDEELPIENECSIFKKPNGVEFLVYGRFYPNDVLHEFLGTYDGKTKEELLEVFRENYKELNNWIKEPVKHP